MESIDKIVFGDNQFFGINHMSQEKAQHLSEKFFDINNIFKIYDQAINAGIKGIMLNSNSRAVEITNYFKKNVDRYKHINWYPSIPYPHKYANLVAEKGIPQTLNEVLLQGNSVQGVLSIIARGSSTLFTKDVVKLMQILIDIEMKIFNGLNVKVIFLQNIITDLLLGYELKFIFKEYINYIKNNYSALPGLITQNMPLLIEKLNEWGIEKVVVCSSFNKIGYLMSPDIESYIDTANNNDTSIYQLMAMSTLASGAIPAKEAYRFINKQKLQSVVFGASSENHIKETIQLIQSQ